MKRFLFFAVAAVLFAACSKDALDEEQGIQNIVDEAPATLTVGFEDDETRIQLNSAQKTVWTKGDLVSVFYLSDANQQWQYTGETGENVGENVAGGAGGNLVFEDTVLTEVTLNCMDGTSPTEKGVEVANTATAFYIALPPQTFTKGITVEITDTTNFTMTQSTDKEVVIERNHIKPMAAFKFVNPNTPTIPTPANNEIWYTATAKVEPYDKTVFGATYVSNVWDSETGKGVITFEGDVTKIGVSAFNGYLLNSIRNTLTSVTIPDSVTTIGDYAFNWCTSLTSVTIPDSVTTIGEGAFGGCSSLTSVTIPDSVTKIGNAAFYDCNSLKEFKGKFAADGGRCLIVDGVLNALGCGATQYTIPDSVTTIGQWAFSGCKSLTSVTIPDSVTTIGECAFIGCNSLTSVTIPDSVTTIGEMAFYYCESLTSVTIPDSVTTIGGRAFEYCNSLTSVTIPDSVTTIGSFAFYHCDRLKEFKGKFAADGGRCLIVDGVLNAFAIGCGVTQYTIPDSVTTIGWGAFEDCNSLTSVTIPDSVTTIGDWAFGHCKSLTSVTIGDSVTTIGNYAFSDCSSLISVTIPDSVTTIGGLAFYGCGSLKTVYCKPTTPPAVGDGMFYYNAAGRRIFIPASDDNSIINAYKEASRWSEYKDSIFEE